MRATPAARSEQAAGGFDLELVPWSACNADAISTPTRTGFNATRSVTTMKTPWQASLANLLAVGVNATG